MQMRSILASAWYISCSIDFPRSAMTTRRVERAISSCMTHSWSAFRRDRV